MKTTQILSALLTPALILLLVLYPAQRAYPQQNDLKYKKNVPVTADPTTLRSDLQKGGARYLDTQEGTVFLQDRIAGLPCTIQFPAEDAGTLTMAVTFQVRDNWKALTADYEKILAAMKKTLGEPDKEKYQLLHFWKEDGRNPDEMEELRAGRCDYYAVWVTGNGSAQLSLTANPDGDCFTSIIYTTK